MSRKIFLVLLNLTLSPFKVFSVFLKVVRAVEPEVARKLQVP